MATLVNNGEIFGSLSSNSAICVFFKQVKLFCFLQLNWKQKLQTQISIIKYYAANKQVFLVNIAQFSRFHVLWRATATRRNKNICDTRSGQGGCSLEKLIRSATLLKRDSDTDVFFWILCNFQETLFWRTSASGCFWRKEIRQKEIST